MSEPFSVASGVVGVVSLGITTCSALLRYYDSWKDSRKDVAAMYETLDRLNKTFILIQQKITSQFFGPDVVERITESIESCNEGIVDLRKRLSKFDSTKSNDWTVQVRVSRADS